MRIKYLGTGSSEGMPSPFCECILCTKAKENGGKDIRRRHQMLINSDLLIDFSPDTFSHHLNEQIDLKKINNVFITHSHSDHFYPEDLVMILPEYSHEISHPLKVSGNNTVINKLNDVLSSQNQSELLINERILRENINPFEKKLFLNYQVTALPAVHDRNEECYIYIVSSNNINILYGHDSSYFGSEVWDYLKANNVCFDLVSLDCTYGMEKSFGGHMNIYDAVEVRDKLLEIGCINNNSKIAISHFSHNGGALHSDLHKWGLVNGFIIAYDGLSIELYGPNT